MRAELVWGVQDRWLLDFHDDDDKVVGRLEVRLESVPGASAALRSQVTSWLLALPVEPE